MPGDDNSMPFGYHGFTNEQGFHFTTTDPAPIPSNQSTLFNNQEAGLLNSFFDHIPNPFEDSPLYEGDYKNNLGLHDDYQWMFNEPPPTLQEVSSTTPNLPTTFHGLPHSAYTTATSNTLPVSAADDVLGAASALVHNQFLPQHVQRPSSVSISQPPQTAHTIPSALSSAYLPPALARATAPSPGIIEGRRQSGTPSQQLIFNLKPWDEEADTTLTPGLRATFDQNAHTGMMRQKAEPRKSFPAHTRTYSESQIGTYHQHPAGSNDDEANQRLYRFGSDSHFQINGYVRNPLEPTEEQLSQRILDDNLGAVGGGFISAASTRPSSPAGWRRIKRDIEDDESDDSARKRRKSGRAEDIPPSAKRQSAAQTSRRRASTSVSAAPFAPPARRRKSSPAAPVTPAGSSNGNGTSAKKPPRENLSDEQKRNNHIVSEQKRRNLIKYGFEELNRLVPALRDGGYSKSNVLVEGASYLEVLVAGNEQLKGMGLRVPEDDED
ncbi:hypothetical protein NA57DRAFT_58712 [Rhizodiscina lignyota]|uniref:BHLH domain-containing protein n=1 Tax=Rhizodiscina lignyota TaxID=1504668 RepID=A0A9P4ICN0_9PEZI|nr:hypothetical protein NA57DRAFT_58712 [Rhizodiscina lignyota]